MAELLHNKKIKPIAFYLPQFHTIPENDKFWGKGFTEWTNVRKATPLFEGHNQPRVPLNENYYDLMDDNIKIWQSDLAQEHGIFGFCYYHYWFKDGKKLLEKPAEQMLVNKKVTIPFCFSWANENWSKRWDGGNKEIIMEQNYGHLSEWISHINYLIKFFQDDRYITFDGDPVFIIYKPELIPNLNEMIKCWNHEVSKYGFKKICFIIQNPSWFYSPTYNPSMFDFQIKFEPFFSITHRIKNFKKLEYMKKIYSLSRLIKIDPIFELIFKNLKTGKELTHRGDYLVKHEYDEVWETIINSKNDDFFINGIFVDWDNTPRSKNGRVFLGASPEKFELNLNLLKTKLNNQKFPAFFINAWNEWAEGTYLEPDTKNELRYLEALKKSLNSS